MSEISILDNRARTKEGRQFSHIVTGTAELTSELVATEAWSPTVYSKPRRAAVNFLEASVIAFDVDDGMLILDAIKLVKDYRHIIGTTASHQLPKGDEPPCDRYRVILFLDSPVFTVEEYKATLKTTASLLGLPADPAAIDGARWFVPCKEIISVNEDGLLIKPSEAAKPASSQKATATPVGERGKLSNSTVRFLAQLEGQDTWHKSFIKAAMDMKEQGYEVDEAAEMLKRASPGGELDETDLNQLSDVYEKRGGALDFRPAWPEAVIDQKSGTIKPVPTSVANYRYLLTSVLGYTFYANTRREVLYYSTQGSSERKLLTDTLLATIKTAAREHKLAGTDAIMDLIITMAQENAFDPILGPLDALAWDGHDHIDDLFHTLKLPEDTPEEHKVWYYIFLRRWLVGLVTKVYNPGSENNVLVFQGEQAAGKSRWLKRLAELWPEGFGEGHINPDDKDHELRHLDNFIWHVAEFDSTTSRKEVGALKDYFTKDTVNVRRPYARLPIVGRSICSFCASVNSYDFLHDATGNRRYLVIPVVGVNADHKVNIPQVFAEAKAAMLAGERQWFTREEILKVNELNSYFLSREEYLEDIDRRCKPGDYGVTIKQILEALGYEKLTVTRAIRSNIRTTLEKNGVKPQTTNGATYYMVDRKIFMDTKVIQPFLVK